MATTLGMEPSIKEKQLACFPPEAQSIIRALVAESECRRCGAKLAGSDPDPLRHQVWELPDIKPIVTE